MSARHGYYVMLFEMPDAKRMMRANSLWAANDKDRAFVFNECRRIVMVNPDVKYDPATFLNGPFATPDEAKAFEKDLEAKLNAEDPNRKSVTDLRAEGVIDQAERLLHDPEISRMLAAQKEANAAKKILCIQSTN